MCFLTRIEPWDKLIAVHDWLEVKLVAFAPIRLLVRLTLLSCQFKMAADERSEGNIRNGLRFFDRTDDFTASKVAIAAREGDEETLRALLADG